ncbi:MAG: hypothetical protein ACI9A1_000419 [Lentimonas sp.]|jgi:hypothetical protein
MGGQNGALLCGVENQSADTNIDFSEGKENSVGGGIFFSGAFIGKHRQFILVAICLLHHVEHVEHVGDEAVAEFLNGHQGSDCSERSRRLPFARLRG